MIRMKRFTHLAALFAVALLAGCSAMSPYSKETKVNLKITASDQLNPDLNGRPSPIVLRLMELKHPTAFENADFFTLYERAKEALAQDMVSNEEIELRPGETLDLKLTVGNSNRYIGVLAAYRDLPETQWRYTVQVVPLAITKVNLALDDQGIHDVDAEAKAKLAKADK